MRLRSVVALVLVALIAGAIAAHADSGAPRRAPAPGRAVTPAPRSLTPAVVCAAPHPLDPARRTPRPGAAAPSAAPPSQALLDAFAVLRRPRTDQDALSPQALQALRIRRLAPVAAVSARLLRSTPSGGKAWVVPVPDVTSRLGCAPVAGSAPREGLAVVATGDAASGGGGALNDLVRGRSPVTVAPCAGTDHSMLSISGIVPDGVPAAFLTAPDGTAVRADVKDNGYEFLLPGQRTTEARYVVWTGGDGTPHVQPVVAALTRPGACTGAAKLPASFARVSPDDLVGCMTAQPLAVDAQPVLPRRLTTRAQRLRLTSALRSVARCWATPVAPKFVLPGGRVPAPPPVTAVPARPVPAPPPVTAVPARPVPAPPPVTAVPARPVPAPAPAVPPARKHR
jgi:hypothetical protein